MSEAGRPSDERSSPRVTARRKQAEPLASFNWLSLLGAPATIGAAVLGFSGYIYIQSYLQYFGLSVFDAKLSPSSFIYYAFRPFVGIFLDLGNGVGPLLAATIVATASYLLLEQKLTLLKKFRLGFGLVVLFVFVLFLARQTALVDAIVVGRGGGTRVELVFTNTPADAAIPSRACGSTATRPGGPVGLADAIPASLSAANECGQLRLVWQSEDAIVVARAYPNAFCRCSAGGTPKPSYCYPPENGDALQMPDTYFIPKARVSFARTTRMTVWTTYLGRSTRVTGGDTCTAD